MIVAPPGAPATLALADACRWVDVHLDEVWSPATLMPSIKAAGELGHAADRLIRLADPRWQRLGHAWLDRAWGWLDGGELLRRLIATDPRLLPAAITYLPFHLQGRHHDALLALLSRRLPELTLRPLEWTIVVAAFELFGIDCGDHPRRLARSISLLANRPDPAAIPVDAMYLLAHECLYATGWGRSPSRASADAQAYVAHAVPILLERCCRLGDPDVLAEVIVTARLHGLAVPTQAWQLLDAARAPDGSIAAVERSTMVLPRIVHPRLGRRYHTTIAAILAWATLLQDPRR